MLYNPPGLVIAFQAQALDYTIVGAGSHFETLRMPHIAHGLSMDGWSQTVAYGPGAAMGLHVAACMPHLTKAYDMVGPYSWIDTLVNEPFTLKAPTMFPTVPAWAKRSTATR